MATGLIVGGWFASAVIAQLISVLIDYVKMQSGLEDKLKQLEGSLPNIKAVLNAVDQGLIKEVNPSLEKWLWQLRDAADQANDVMDEIEYNSVMANIKGKKNKMLTFLQRAVNTDPLIKNLNKAVEVMAKVSTDVEVFFQLANKLEKAELTISNRETSPVLNVKISVFGREKEKADIIERLLNPVLKTNKVNFGVLPIIGAGGVGKTTLAQLVYNDQVVKDHFELRVWVCVSNNFDVTMLTKKMYLSAINQRDVLGTFTDHQLELEEKFKSCKFLVVFDDVWNDNDERGWEKLVAPLRSGKSGSMILLTTRTKEVAILAGPNLMDPYYINGLKEGEMWGLFVESAFGHEDPNNHKTLLQIGREIVMKLEGSPLAAKTVGGILKTKLDEKHWKRILRSELWSLEQGPNEIMPTLRLTYQYLPSHLKPCFSFCSIFPKDHIFVKDDLIYMWIALGLVGQISEGETPEDVGSKYFEEMLNRSIFSPANPVSNAKLCYPVYTYYSMADKQFNGGYIMHGLLHDLSTSVSQGECFRYDTNKPIPIPTTVRHLYVHVDGRCELSDFHLKNIHSLIIHFDNFNDNEALVCILNTLLKGTRNIRLLTLLALNLSELPESVSDLIHLRYLSLSSFMLGRFPESMSKLYLLETMVCGGFGFTNQANVLVKLINLRHIIASESFVDAIAGIGKLTSLQELSFRVNKEIGFRISELSNMRELRRLAITNINDVVDHEEAKQSNLRHKIDLNELILQWDTTGFDEKVFDHLQPNCNLKELIIRNYMGHSPPSWKPGSLSSLVKLEICDCPNLVKLGEGLLRDSDELVGLKELIITNCRKLEMPEKGLSEFISLRRLDMSSCPNVKLFNVLLLYPPPKLQFLRIDSYVLDCIEKKSYVKDIMDDLTIPESSLRQTPELHTKEAELFILDHPGENSNWDMSLLRMRDYIGIWPPTWLTETLSMLDSLCIHGWPSTGNYYFSRLPNEMSRLLNIVIKAEITSCDVYSSLDMAYPSDMSALEQIYFATSHINCLQHLKKLTVYLCSKTCSMPYLPVTLKELVLYRLGLSVIPNFFGNQSSDLWSLPSLVSMEIILCPNLVSLAEELFQNPQQFAALEKLKIWGCQKLRELPQGGFNKFISLKELKIEMCPKIEGQLVPKCFLPSALQVLHVYICGGLDANLSKALKSVYSLSSLSLEWCTNISSLPPKEVFGRWKTLEKLELVYCDELTSLESLLGLSSVRLLTIHGCPKLVSAITSPSVGKKDEIEGIVEDGTIQTSNRPALPQPTPTAPYSSTNTEHKPLLSVDELEIDDPLLLYIEPIRSLSYVRKLTIIWCLRMQSLPELPPIHEELSLNRCSPELKRRCEESGEDWPKLSHIPKVFISETFI